MASSLPSVTQYKATLPKAASHPSNVPMLVAHYRSPDRSATPEALARAVGFESRFGANMQYGNLAGRICRELNCNFEPHVRILAHEANGVWIMHDEVARALEELGWVGELST